MKTEAVSPSYAEFKEQKSKGKEKRERGGDNPKTRRLTLENTQLVTRGEALGRGMREISEGD